MTSLTDRYFKAPNDVWSANLDKYEKLVYLYLCRCQNNDKPAYPSYNAIATNCRISRNKAIDIVKTLEKKELVRKFIRRDSGRKNNSNSYELIHENLINYIDVKSDVTEIHRSGSVQRAPGNAPDAPNKEPLYKERINNGQLNIELTHLLSNELKTLLEYYYQLYEQHIGKNHPHLKQEQIQRVGREIDLFSKEFDVDLERLKQMVDEHFHRSIKTDYNINHFATEGILENLWNNLFYG